MSFIGIFLLVVLCWMVLAVGHKALCLVFRLMPAGLLTVAALFCAVVFFGPGCDRQPTSGQTFYVGTDGVARPVRVVDGQGMIVDLVAGTSTPAAASTTIPVETVPPRPAWVDAPGKLVDSVYSVPVKSGLFASLPESQRALDGEIKREADHYITEYLGEADAAERVDISLDYLKQHVKHAEFSEVVESASVGPMHQIHALLQFDDSVRNDFQRLRRDSLVSERLRLVGVCGAAVLASLSAMYGYLRWNLRGRRTPPSGTRTVMTAALFVTLGWIVTRMVVTW